LQLYTDSYQVLSPLNARYENLKSLGGGSPTSIKFVNLSRFTAEIYWLNYNGDRVQYTSLEPGLGCEQPTYVHHPWEVVINGRTMQYLPGEGTANVYIESSDATPTVPEEAEPQSGTASIPSQTHRISPSRFQAWWSGWGFRR
jgi:hypothetical protein